MYFADPANCREYLVARRWPDGVICPRCGSNVLFLEKYNRWHCREKHDAPQFTLKTGTVMEDSPIGLDKWLMVMWQIVNCKNGISSCEVHRAIGITQKSAWFMDHRIRFALGMDSGEKLSGHVEADETFIGGKARNMHEQTRARSPGPAARIKSSGHGYPGTRRRTARPCVVDTSFRTARKKRFKQKSVSMSKPERRIFSDALQSYNGLDGFATSSDRSRR